MKNIQIKVEDCLHQSLKVKAAKENKDMSEIGRNLFTRYLIGEIQYDDKIVSDKTERS